MPRLITAALLGALSLTACAQAPQAPAADKPAAAKPATASTAASGSAEDRARAAIAKLNPRAKVEYVGAAPLPGFREVIAGGQLLYVSDDGRYLMQGAVLDLEAQEDLMQNSPALAEHRRKLAHNTISIARMQSGNSHAASLRQQFSVPLAAWVIICQRSNRLFISHIWNLRGLGSLQQIGWR